MKRILPIIALGTTVFGVFAAGCATPDHRMNVAASRDEDRRATFEQCRAQGHSDCDTILNAPVNSNTDTRDDAARERERRSAYNRCVVENGRDCEELYRR